MSKLNGQLCHDINSQLSAVMSSLDLVKDEWKENPDLVSKIFPMIEDKLKKLQLDLDHFYQENTKH